MGGNFEINEDSKTGKDSTPRVREKKAVLWKGSTPCVQGKHFLARCNTCNMSETHLLSLMG